MRIALCSSFVPFVRGGATKIVDDLGTVLEELGHQVEKIYLPHLDAPHLILSQMAAFRWLDLSTADRVICFRPPAHAISHPHKVVWFIHHIRVFYDLWDSPYRGFPANRRTTGIRAALHAADTSALTEAKRLFTNSNVVSQRLKLFNGLKSTVLYPPLHRPDRFARRGFNDEIVCVSRIVPHKRQHLLVEAMKHTRTAIKLRICGASFDSDYQERIREIIVRENLRDRVILDIGWLDEAEKCRLLSDCLAVAYIPLDEDSYGYLTLESGYSGKAVITATDSGGILELVEGGYNGIVADPSPCAIAQAMDRLFLDRVIARQMGDHSLARIRDLKIDWPHVVDSLLA